MRINLKLKALSNVSQEHYFQGYFTAMHGFLANIAGKDEKYGKYCFGNIFPIKNQKIKQNEEYSLIISSSDPSIIEKIFFSLNIGKKLNIGALQFTIKEVGIEKRKLKNTSTIESLSPINITTHEKGKIKFRQFREKDYLNLLEAHLLKKYAFLKEKKVPETNLFKNVEVFSHEKHPFNCFQINFFNKQKSENFKVCGSKLVFKFNQISDKQLEIFQTLFDAGFGERTTFGAGFMIERWGDD